MKILKLDIDSLNEDFFEGTRLLGIIAPIKKYTFCWLLNSHLGFRFRLCSDKEIPLLKKNRNYFFSIYLSQQPNVSIEHILYHNHCDGEYLLPEFKHMDYLWLIRGDDIIEDQINWIKKSIREMNGVQMVAEITNEHIKNKGNLVFDI
jgi:hypothetical protein